jgi:hypothetical protein
MKPPDSESLLHRELVIRSERHRRRDRRQEKRNEMIVIVVVSLLMLMTGVWYWFSLTGRL